jgi:hypothetical protein
VYAWIWRHLPGPFVVRGLLALMLVSAAVAVLFSYVFPWLEPLSPFGGSGSVDIPEGATP